MPRNTFITKENIIWNAILGIILLKIKFKINICKENGEKDTSVVSKENNYKIKEQIIQTVDKEIGRE